MPEEKKHDRHRIVVEEVEAPKETSEVEKVEVIDENAKVSSEELTNGEKVQLIEDKVEENPEPEITEKVEDKATEEVSSGEKPVLDAPIPQTPEEPKTKQKSPVFWILIPGIFILGAILGGLIFYQKGINTINVDESPVPIATTSPSETPEPSASPAADLSKIEIAVFNGSGTAGEAGKVKTLLEDAGFTVVSTGNAATYDYTDTIIKAKSTVDDSVIKKIKDALSDTYSVGDNETLSTSATTDIQVVVGSSKAE